MMNLTWRHLLRHWHLNVAVLLCLTLASALLVTFSSYTTAIATQELHQNLEEASPSERVLLLTGTRYTFRETLYERLQEILSPVLKERLVIRHATSPADPLPSNEGVDNKQAITLLDLYSFNLLTEHVGLVEGRWPSQVRLYEAEDSWRPPPIEAVISQEAAEQAGYGIGDQITGKKTYHRLNIVGIVTPLDPHDDIWGEDLSAFEINTSLPDLDADAIALPLIIASTSMQSNYPEVPIFPHEVSWRITLNHHLLSVDKAGELHSDLINFQTQSATQRAKTSTDLVRMLADYLSRLSRVRMTLWLLTVQALLFVLYTLTTFASSLVDRSQVELATLSGRGSSAWQMTQVFALENLILALPAALVLGPGLALGVIRLWSRSTGEVLPDTLPREAWLLSLVAAGLGWMALVLPVYTSARRDAGGWMHIRARPPQVSAAQQHYLDFYLLAFGGLLYWQLNRSGSFVMRHLEDTHLADPLLLIGPSLLLIASAMIFLRVWPYLLRLLAWLFQHLRGLVLPLGLSRLARDPLQPGRVVLLVSLTAGLVLFTRTFGDSLADSQEAMAAYLAGADVRLSLDQPTPLPVDQLAGQPGVQALSPVFRGNMQTGEGETIPLLAVDPDSFAQVACFPPGLSDVALADVLAVLKSEPGGGRLPAAFVGENDVGDQMDVYVAGGHLPLNVRAAVPAFPTLSAPSVVVSLPTLEAQMGTDALALYGANEAWLAVDPVQYESLVDNPVLQTRILADAHSQLRSLQSDALTRGTNNALRLNTLALALFSVTAFFLVLYFAAQGRVHEFSVLRSMGFSSIQSLALLVLEGMLVLLLGLLAGTIIGLGLSQVMIPYLSQALADSLAGVAIERILIDWPAIGRLYSHLAAAYGSALLLLLLVLLRTRAHWKTGAHDLLNNLGHQFKGRRTKSRKR